MGLTSYAFDPGGAADFATLQSRLYAGDDNWIPPLACELRARFAPAFAFYRRTGNRHRHFVATAGGHTAGHVLATVNRDLEDRDGTPVGALGFFECVEDHSVAVELLDCAVQWLREHGLRRIWGPIDFDIWNGYRLMTRGFDQPTFYGEPYNKRYYPELFDRFGFKIRQKWNSAVFTGRDALEALAAGSERRYLRLTRDGCRFAPIDLGSPSQIRTLHDTLTCSFRGFLGFTPLSLGDFERLSEARRRLSDPKLMSLIYDERGTVAGFAVAYPDHSAALRAMRSRTGAVSKLRFLWHRARGAHRAIFYMGGLTPDELRRHRGLGRVAFHHTVRQILAAGYDEMVVALVAVDGPAQRYLNGPTVSAKKEYALFELDR